MCKVPYVKDRQIQVCVCVCVCSEFTLLLLRLVVRLGVVWGGVT